MNKSYNREQNRAISIEFPVQHIDAPSWVTVHGTRDGEQCIYS